MWEWDGKRRRVDIKRTHVAERGKTGSRCRILGYVLNMVRPTQTSLYCMMLQGTICSLYSRTYIHYTCMYTCLCDGHIVERTGNTSAFTSKYNCMLATIEEKKRDSRKKVRKKRWQEQPQVTKAFRARLFSWYMYINACRCASSSIIFLSKK